MPAERCPDAELMLRIAQRDLLLLCRLINDLGGDPSPFQQLVNFSPFGTRLRYDEEESLGLDRALWNQRCADLLDHVAALIP
jgi:hypothetical protein